MIKTARTLRPISNMLRSISVALLIFSCQAAKGQVLLEVHAKPFSTGGYNLERRFDGSNKVGNEQGISKRTDFGMTVSMGNRKNLFYVMDLNWNHESYRNNNEFVYPENPNWFRTSTSFLGVERIELGLGIDQRIFFHDRILSFVGIRALYAHQFNYRYEWDSQNTDSLGVTLLSQTDVRQYPNENTFGLEAVGRIYFKITKRFSIGMNLINRFGFSFVSGTYTQERVTLDADGNETYYLKQAVSGTETRFAYNFSVSFGIQYQLAKRKEKKKKADPK